MNQIKKAFGIMKNSVKGFVMEEDGVGIVEIILILVVLVGLVVIFHDKIGDIVNNALDKVDSDSSNIIG